MRHLGIFLFLVGGMAAGFGISEALLKADPSPAPSTQRPAANSETASDENGADTDPGAPVEPDSNGTSPEAEVAFQRVVNQLIQESPAHDGVIEGQVLNDAGVPLASVEIKARGVGPRSRATSNRTESATDHVRLAYQRAARRSSEQSVQSDSEGRFRLTELDPNREYTVRGTKPSFEIESARGFAGQRIELIGKRIFALPVEVRMPNGELAESAQVSTQGGRSVVRGLWTPDSPELDFRPGVHEVFATLGDFRSPSVTVTVSGQQGSQPVILQLEGRIGIRGNVTIAGSKPSDANQGRVSAWIRPLGNGAPDDAILATGDSDHAWSGSFSFLDLAPGRYHVGVGRFPDIVEQSQVLDVRSEIVEIEFDLSPVTADQVLVIRVTNPQGQPVSNVSFGLTYRSQSRSSSGTLRYEEQLSALGEYWAFVGQKFWDSLANESTRCILTARTSDFGSVEVEVFEGSIDIQLSTPATLTVRYPGYVGSGLEGQVATLLEDVGERDGPKAISAYRRNDERAPDGSIQIGPTEPGEYVLVTRVSGDIVSEEPITLVAGDNTYSVQLPTFYSLTLRVDPSDVDRRLQIASHETSDDSGRGEEIPAGTNSVTVENLMAGIYDLMVEQQGEITIMQVEIRQNTTVKFEPNPLNAIRIAIFDPEGAFAKAGFEDGDVIVGIGDSPVFENMMQLQVQLMSLMGNSEAKVRIQRNGKTEDLVFDASFLSGPGSFNSAGGKFLPATRTDE